MYQGRLEKHKSKSPLQGSADRRDPDDLGATEQARLARVLVGHCASAQRRRVYGLNGTIATSRPRRPDGAGWARGVPGQPEYLLIEHSRARDRQAVSEPVELRCRS